jgi:heme oxygenase
MRKFYCVTNCETGSSEPVLANGHVDAMSYYRKCNNVEKLVTLECTDIISYNDERRYAVTKLSELPDHSLFYKVGDFSGRVTSVLMQKIETMANGMVRCRMFYDTIRPDSYFKSSTKVTIIPEEEQTCLKSGTM